ncbi:ribosomal protein L17 [Hygrophoropsis aurantiaca]|uniref:Ribosomal protein L17 n=1 Tax=Hygrophoropsis aurantiaca TaxID=72124 RepID=A0ACB8AF33_9AGAM|nr:ribosomal protein L17 [Hygrophoropsis aurantiaca]
MKHGVAFRKFSRTSSHRNLMLRNLVSSLFEHEQIKTTLAKAKDTARLAEKIITLGKKGNETSYRRAQGFLLQPATLPKLFTTLAQRYSERPGGYTRIHRLGNRTGDNAPLAMVELVDNPRDLKLELTARAIGRELLNENLRQASPRNVANQGLPHARDIIKKELTLNGSELGNLRTRTRWNLQKVVRYRGMEALSALEGKTTAYIETLLAKPISEFKAQARMQDKAAAKAKQREQPNFVEKLVTRPSRAGAIAPGEIQPAMRLAQGALARPPRPKKVPFWQRGRVLGQPTPYTLDTLYN